jgi:hypothetical protein
MENIKKIWRGTEITIRDDLMSFKQGLIDDFMAGYSTLEEAVTAQCEDCINRDMYSEEWYESSKHQVTHQNPITRRWESGLNWWRGVMIRTYIKGGGGQEPVDMTIDEEGAKRYPTMMKMLEKYHDKCYGLVYGVMGPRTILHRHLAPENVEGLYVRIHIPLIVPKGDLFLECHGEEVTWDDLYGFNNQHLHSAHNLSEEWRLVAIIDIDREHAGLSKGTYHNEDGAKNFKNFTRGWIGDK